ncbi:signal transduction histidine kinase [Larkinella arboricola]|uniref:histidine kinase n=1 Tax=Larkinella arboricola TaxID=643671 RepID=A0A327WQ73_LARAB|nr:ATP-binding protein [Larkinella arboricola]RAJ94374.1 signal transduction histidine kinase [Larkinella arboricola]
MNTKLPLWNWSLAKTLNSVTEPLMKEQVRIFYFMFIMNIPKLLLAIATFYQAGDQPAMFKQIRIFLVSLIVLKILLARPRRIYSLIHFLQVSTILVLWYAFYKHKLTWGINAHLQLVLFMLSAFFGLGRNWGFIYSILSLMPYLIGLIGMSGVITPFNVFSEEPVTLKYVLMTIINFAVLVGSSYYFHRALYGAIQQGQSLNNQLQESLQAKSNFLSTMSHELRTPLNSVIGMTNLLLADRPRETQKENLNILRFSAESLLSLINNILDFNKIDLKKVELETIPFHLPRLLDDTSASMAPKAYEKGLLFELSVDPELTRQNVLGDPTRLTQILFNLVGNAIKFTQQGSVALTARVVARQADSLDIRFTVTDTGIGISDEQQKMIFEPFVQASSMVNRRFGGTGLGLAIVKHLLELHHSAIHVKSQPQHGTQFYFDLHYKTSPLQETPANGITAVPQSLEQVRVLLAEDNAMNITLMERLLTRWGIELTVAEDGRQVLELMETNQYDIILMDIQMPELNGFQTAERIRQLADPQKAGIPIIALTAAISTEVIARIKESGMNDYISKPFKLEDLYYKLAQSVASHLPNTAS